MKGSWRSRIRVSPSSLEITNRDICLIWPLACSSQFGSKLRILGTYELEEDAARAYEKVASILGRSDPNFPNSDGLEINGPRSEGADTAVAAAVEAARALVAAKAAKKNKTSAPACQVRRESNTAHGLPSHSVIHEI